MRECETVWIVVPAFNEGLLLPAIVDGLAQQGYHVAVVDDGSRIPLLPAIASSQAHVLRHAVNLGQGAALQTGIDYALLQGAEYIVTFDADGQHQIEDIERLLEPLRAGHADVVLGTRFGPGGAAKNITQGKRFVLGMATWLARLSTGLRLTDTHNGLRAFSAEAAPRLEITQNRMAHASEILSRIARARLRYVEMPVTIMYTPYSVQKGQRLSNLVNILWELLRGNLYP